MQTKLFERDWHSLMEAILRINSTTDVPMLQKVSLECIRALISCDQYIFFISKTNDRASLCQPVTLGVEAKYISEFLNGAYDSEEDSELFFSGKHILRHNTETTRDSDQIPEEYLISTKIYREMYVKQNIHYAMRSSLMFRREYVGTIELYNSKHRGDFSDKQLEIQTLLAPHIANHLGLLLAMETMPQASPAVSAEAIKHQYGLTTREAEIIALLSSGKDDCDIISELYISDSTFKKHLYNAYRKIGISSRSQLYNKLYSANAATNEKLPTNSYQFSKLTKHVHDKNQKGTYAMNL